MKIKTFLLFNVMFLFFVSVCYAQKIKSVIVDLYIDKTAIHSLVFSRIQESVEKVAEKIIVGQDIDTIISSREILERTLQNVFSQAMSGFFVSEVKLKIGEITGISLYLSPSSDIVQSVKINIISPQVYTNWQNIFWDDIEVVAPKINSILIGIPVESYSWIQYGLRQILVGLIQSYDIFQGFTPSIDISLDKEAKITIKLDARQPTVKQIKLKISSTSLPNLFLVQVKYALQGYLNNFIGLPAEYLALQKDKIEKDMVNIIADSKWKKYLFIINVSIREGEVTEIILKINSQKYYSYITGHFDIGLEKENILEIRGHIGRMLTRSTSVFIRPDIIVNDLKMQTRLGVGKQFKENFFVAVEHNLKDEKDNIFAIFEKDKIRCTYIGEYSGEIIEASIGYKFRNFFIIEAIKRKDKYGARGVITF